MKKTTSLNELLMEELTDLLNAESQLVEALPKMAQASQSSALKSILDDHLKITKEHLFRLQDIFSNTGQRPQGVTCKAMKNIIAEGAYAINDAPKGPGSDDVIISVAQRAQQYEIVGYRAASEHAFDLGYTRMTILLDKTLDEERAMNLHLNELAQGVINVQTIKPSGGFYIPEEKFKRGETKKKSKNIDVSRFISEGNPNIQEPQEKSKEDNQSLKNPEEEGDQS